MAQISREAQEKLARLAGLPTPDGESEGLAQPADPDAPDAPDAPGADRPTGGASRAALRETGRATADAEIFADLARIIQDATGIDMEEIEPGQDLEDDLHIDSLSRIDIAVRLEDRYHVLVDEQAIFSARTVADAVEFIRNEVGAQDGHDGGSSGDATA
ncbi:acyl carrier protein [Corynebacterium bovis]|uniref:Acyl carrier protein n=1 Tax=Corynebacterium bovis DSM 20582 = CIP 54.80 TaxID=927655 RepID=A0A8H9Y7U6_9CORY|nr:acyl carrier protein [Corynebacterium bovis]MBB3114968.1 acyl carrier protein [Corynebacterium bovis DSM 20582 = CIP 54.80]QQC48041.1 acyl carrier protein [Corynebacterium bovis]RRO80808.1 acyl carrier protein [Corynebacterium bovis]RRO81285.1 acyl carrier protein [Corynebacterium bovis]RRO84270.1 acyl carrier protein [Corynebacterium bovis]